MRQNTPLQLPRQNPRFFSIVPQHRRHHAASFSLYPQSAARNGSRKPVLFALPATLTHIFPIARNFSKLNSARKFSIKTAAAKRAEPIRWKDVRCRRQKESVFLVSALDLSNENRDRRQCQFDFDRENKPFANNDFCKPWKVFGKMFAQIAKLPRKPAKAHLPTCHNSGPNRPTLLVAYAVIRPLFPPKHRKIAGHNLRNRDRFDSGVQPIPQPIFIINPHV